MGTVVVAVVGAGADVWMGSVSDLARTMLCCYWESESSALEKTSYPQVSKCRAKGNRRDGRWVLMIEEFEKTVDQGIESATTAGWSSL